MAWQAKQTATQLTSVTTEQFFSFGGSAFVTLNPRELLHFQVAVAFGVGTTDDAVISIYGTLDDSSEVWDDTGSPLQQFTLGRVSSTTQHVSFTIAGPYKVRVGVKRSTGTDTFATADCAYRRDGVAAS